MPQKFKYDQNLYMAVQHTLYPYYAWVGAPAELGAVALLIVLCFLVRGRKPSFALTLAATICMAAWFAVVAPANTQMAQWTTIPLPDSWMDTRRHWEFGHATSAVLDLIGFGALMASVLFDRTEE